MQAAHDAATRQASIRCMLIVLSLYLPRMTCAGSCAQPENTPDTPDDEEERFGPLALRRLLKEEGRALILYTRADEPDGEHG
jgi:hypothetical protein